MNKAFLREPDDNGQRFCPRCGSLGVPVSAATWQAQLADPAAVQLAEPASFCPFARCEIVYFDEFDRTVPIESLRQAVYPKDADAPMCGCFGLTCDDVEQDLREGGAARVRALLAKSKSPEAHCQVRSASGQCCIPEVQKYFMKRRAELAE
jgi:Zinc binding domain